MPQSPAVSTWGGGFVMKDMVRGPRASAPEKVAKSRPTWSEGEKHGEGKLTLSYAGGKIEAGKREEGKRAG